MVASMCILQKLKYGMRIFAEELITQFKGATKS